MRLQIRHVTSFTYETPATYALQRIRLTPRSSDAQEVAEWETTVDGATKEVEFVDQHMNLVELISFESGASMVRIESAGTVETADSTGVATTRVGSAPLWLYLRETALTKPGDRLHDLVSVSCPDRTTVDIAALHALSAAVAEAVTYGSGATTIKSKVEDVLEAGIGVCQDHAHVFIAAVRSLGIPARYVSGYLMMDDRIDQEATHAWAEVWIDDLGWVGFDVSNGISPDQRYVRLAAGLDYREAAPTSGLLLGASPEQLDVSVQVQQQ